MKISLATYIQEGKKRGGNADEIIETREQGELLFLRKTNQASESVSHTVHNRAAMALSRNPTVKWV